MPRPYDPPEWFTPEYERRMARVLEAIRREFAGRPPVDEGYLRRLLESDLAEHRSRYEVLASGADPVYDGPGLNTGWNVVRTRNRWQFQWALPSYLAACIEVREDGSSLAETTDMPWILAEELTASEPRKLESLLHRVHGLTMGQMRAIRSVLDLIETMGDYEGRAARAALASFWGAIPPIVPLEEGPGASADDPGDDPSRGRS